MKRGKKKFVGMIDFTPTWRAVLPVFIAALVDGSDRAKDDATKELLRMAEMT